MPFPLHAKEGRNGCFVQLRADDAKLAGNISAAHPDIMLAGHKIKVDPAAGNTRYDALCPENHTVFVCIQGIQSILNLLQCKFLSSFHTPGSKDLVGMMVMMVMAAGAVFIVVMMLMLMIVAAAAMLIMVMMVMLVLMVVTAAAMLLVVMVMVMLVLVLMIVAAAAMLIMAGRRWPPDRRRSHLR